MINTFGFQFKNWFADELSAQKNSNSIIHTPAPLPQPENQKFAISIKEMQMISNALIIYAKHLNKKEENQRADEALSLENRIFQYLNTVRSSTLEG